MGEEGATAIGLSAVHRPVAVVGAGSIGVAWALVFARARLTVRVYEPDAGRRAAAPQELIGRLAGLAAEGLLPERPEVVSARVTLTADLRRTVADVRYVQECAPERLELKKDLFAELDAAAPAEAVLASSSSALTCSAIAAGLDGAARCLIAHPGNPPYLLPVVELVPGPRTVPQTIAAADALLRASGMLPIRLSREIEGFVFNRLQGAVLREAYNLVRDGVATPEDIDMVMREGLGRRWSVLGPFETAELNTRGGIDAHARVMGPAYARMAAERGEITCWDEELVAQVSRAVRRRFPRELWSDHIVWRDRALMVLDRCRRDHALLAGPPSSATSRNKPQPLRRDDMASPSQ